MDRRALMTGGLFPSPQQQHVIDALAFRRDKLILFGHAQCTVYTGANLAMGAGRVGLRGMRERIAQIGGELQFKSDSKGTTVAVVVPIEKMVAA